MKTNQNATATLVEATEQRNGYGQRQEIAVIDHSEWGVTLLLQGYSGTESQDQNYRWRSGMAVQLQEGETLAQIMRKDDTGVADISRITIGELGGRGLISNGGQEMIRLACQAGLVASEAALL